MTIACKNDPARILKQDYAEYHLETLVAEEWIATKDYKKALEVYEELMNSYSFVFLRDQKIAVQLALLLGENRKAINYLKTAISKGWEMENLKDNTFILDKLSKIEWKNIEEEYDELHHLSIENIDSDLRGVVEFMYKKDQALAKVVSMVEDESQQEIFVLNTFSSESEKQLEHLSRILEDDGYPGEQKIANNFWMSTIVSHHNSIAQDYVLKDSLYNSIKPKLLIALSLGQISPYEFALMEDWKKAVESDEAETVYAYVNPPRETFVARINNSRQKIGLRSIELRNSLVNLEEQSGMNFYLPDWVDGKILIQKN